jgi:hypothetical protein
VAAALGGFTPSAAPTPQSVAVAPPAAVAVADPPVEIAALPPAAPVAAPPAAAPATAREARETVVVVGRGRPVTIARRFSAAPGP